MNKYFIKYTEHYKFLWTSYFIRSFQEHLSLVFFWECVLQLKYFVYKTSTLPESFIKQVSVSGLNLFQPQLLRVAFIFIEQCASLTQNAGCCYRIVLAGFLQLVNKSANILSLNFVLFCVCVFGFVIFTTNTPGLGLNEVRFRFARIRTRGYCLVNVY